LATDLASVLENLAVDLLNFAAVLVGVELIGQISK
jgi:hypothetical protein